MRIERLLTDLGFTENEVNELISSKGVVQERYENLYYARFLRGTSLFKRWTVIFGVNDIIPPYPPVRRIYNIKNGLSRHFGEKEFYLEELVDGYNVRIVSVLNRILAITRDGIVCPFSTERISDFFDVEKFFKDHPELILVGEIAGPDNPYVHDSPTYIKEDIQFFLIDIMKKTSGELLPVEERMKLAEEYRIPQVRCFGKFTINQLNEVIEFIEMIDDEGNEGVVFKDPESKLPALKFTTPSAECQDILRSANFVMETHLMRFIDGFIRIAAYIAEFKLKSAAVDNLSKKLGKAILKPIIEVFENVENKKPVEEEFKIIVKNPETAQKLIDLYYKRGIEIKINDIKMEKDRWIVIFSIPHPQTASKLSSLWRGTSIID